MVSWLKIANNVALLVFFAAYATVLEMMSHNTDSAVFPYVTGSQLREFKIRLNGSLAHVLVFFVIVVLFKDHITGREPELATLATHMKRATCIVMPCVAVDMALSYAFPTFAWALSTLAMAASVGLLMYYGDDLDEDDRKAAGSNEPTQSRTGVQFTYRLQLRDNKLVAREVKTEHAE